VTFHVSRGEFVFLTGPSGAGKSTLIKLLHMEERPTDGTMMVGGVNLNRLPRRHVPRFRRNLGVVFQDYKLLSSKTVYQNVAFALEVVGAPVNYIKRRVPAVLAMVGLEEMANRRPEQLSGGEQQRVSMARAVVNSPKIILADEPTGNLDRDTSWEIMRLLLEFNRRGATILVATHDWAVVDAMKKRVLELREGRLTRDDAQGGYEAHAESSQAIGR
jgi:cell division transport system ATP-binding protein